MYFRITISHKQHNISSIQKKCKFLFGQHDNITFSKETLHKACVTEHNSSIPNAREKAFFLASVRFSTRANSGLIRAIKKCEIFPNWRQKNDVTEFQS